MTCAPSLRKNALRTAGLALFTLTLTAADAHAVGEPVNGFPTWAERVIHEWINRARVDPQVEMNACGSPCVERACYSVMAPLTWNEALNRSARFHSDEMVHQGYFAHNSACTLVSNIASLYPASCDGSASCACVGGTEACSPTCTGFAQRVQLFGGSPSGEIIASPSDPNQAFYLWLFEPGDTMSCQFTLANGHRWLILTSSGAVGAGVAGYSTGDFGAGSAPTKIPSGTHYPQQSSSVQAWANWYDAAGPSAASIDVDGTCTAMTLQRGTQTNGAWAATLTGVGSGCHRYYFDFRDSAGTSVTYPTTGSLAIGSGAACPDWDSARPPACAAGTGSPTPSPTPSPPTTPTQSPSRTPSRTPTFTPSPSRTPVPSASATASRTLSPTSPATASATLAATPSPTATQTAAAPGQDVSGYLRYYSNAAPVPHMAVHASGPAAAISSSTDASGHYVLADAPANDVIVSADGAGGIGSAISALDAAYVLQFVAGLRPLSAEQSLACDVSGNGSLSALDAAYVLQYTVGLITRFPVATACNSDWAFIPTPASVPTQTLIQPQPGAASCTLGGIAYQLLSAPVDEQNFSALVFGDCTGNWQPPAQPSTALAVRSAARPGVLRSLRGGRMALPISVERPEPVYALDVRVSYDPTALRPVTARPVGRARRAVLAFNAREPGVVRIAVASGAAIAADGRPIVEVVFAAPRGRRVAAPAVSVRFDDD
jgi:hypothetical protein